MATDKLKSEHEFLIDLAVDQFNDQYGRNILASECKIKSLPADYGSDIGYEIYTRSLTDYLKMRIYLSMGDLDELANYRLETTAQHIERALGDEVYVAMGSVNWYYVDAGIYRFRWIEGEPVTEEVLSFLDGTPFTMMDGDALTFVKQAE